MVKALLKKQFLELNASYFQDRKTGKMRSKTGIILYTVLIAFVFLSLGATFLGVAGLFASSFVGTELEWLYFAIMGLLAMALGIFGSVFNTYSHLYLAKDNELLLAMPIPPSKILLSRMVGVFAMGLLYEALIMVPTVIMYWVFAKLTVLNILFPILLVFILGFFIMVLTCFFGWLVALISSKLKNKSFITVLISLAFIVVYYLFIGMTDDFLTTIVENAAKTGTVVKNAAYPLYLLGRAASGDILSMVLFTALVALLVVATVWILSKTFLRIATPKNTATKAVYTEKAVKVGSVDGALLRKEWKRFASSPTYMLNCALGTVLTVAASVALLIVSPTVRTLVEVFPLTKDFLAVAAFAAVCMIASMNDITAPSVSLEGKSIWILQVVPVPAAKALEAKMRLHWLLTVPPVLLLSVALSVALKLNVYDAFLMLIASVLFVLVSAAFGLIINLKRPDLEWTNESVPVKQSIGVVICLFGGWLFAAIIGVAGYFATKILPGYAVLLILIVFLAVGYRLLDRWLKTTGAKIFETL